MSRIALWVSVGIIAVWGLSWAAIVHFVPTWGDRSNFGQMFGAIGALFSGLALAGVVLAILLQKQELRLQRKELRLTRDELKRAAEAQETAARIAREQARLLLTTARLNAMSTLVHFHSTSSFYAEPATGSAYEKKIRTLLAELEAAAH